MLPYLPETARRVLEVGCGSGAFAAVLKGARNAYVAGIEPQPAAAAQAAGRLDRVIEGDIDAGIEQLGGERFDCIVFNDVLEHLIDPWAALAAVRPLLGAGGVVVASIPNMRYMPVLKDLVLQGQWTYRQDGVMDQTHLRFFTQASIRSLFESSGYRLRRIDGINGLVFPWKFALLNRLSGGRFADVRYQQFAVVAEPVQAAA